MRIDLLYTTFTNNNNRLSYIPNTTLFAKKIENIRSKNEYEQITLQLDENTNYDKMEKLKNKIKELCKKKKIFLLVMCI